MTPPPPRRTGSGTLEIVTAATIWGSAGVIVTQWRSESAFYAANALSTTLPGGPVLATTFLYRQQRRWGASPVVARVRTASASSP